MLGSSRYMRMKAETSVAAAPTAPANSSCSADGSGPEFSMRDTYFQERGEGKAVIASRSKALSNSGRKRINAMTSRPDTRLDRPLARFLHVHLEVDVNEPVAQRCGHPRRSGTVRIAVPGGHNRLSVRQGIFAELAVQHELIATGLDHRGRGVQFVQKQNVLSILREKLRSGPLRSAIFPDKGQTTEVHRIEQQGSYVA